MHHISHALLLSLFYSTALSQPVVKLRVNHDTKMMEVEGHPFPLIERGSPENGFAAAKSDAEVRAEIDAAAAVGANCYYVILYTAGGDADDTPPFCGNNYACIDFDEITRWHAYIQYANSRHGMAVHLLFSERENARIPSFDGYRNMLRTVAGELRDCRLLIYDLGEESPFRGAELIALRDAIREVDPWTPILVHNENAPGADEATFLPIAESGIGAALQVAYPALAEERLVRWSDTGMFVYLAEFGPANLGAPPNAPEYWSYLTETAIWPAMMAGDGMGVYYGAKYDTASGVDHAQWAGVYTAMHRTVDLLNRFRGLEMHRRPDLALGRPCLADDAGTRLVYLREGGGLVALPAGNFVLSRFSPYTCESLERPERFFHAGGLTAIERMGDGPRFVAIEPVAVYTARVLRERLLGFPTPADDANGDGVVDAADLLSTR